MSARNLAIGLFAAVAFAGTANAADLYNPPPPAPAYLPAPAAWSWTGIYFGGNIGYGWASKSWWAGDDAENISEGTFLGSGTGSGFLAGAQIGANWQIGSIVLGLQGDIDWANINVNAANPLSPDTGNCWGASADQTAECRTNVDWLANLTARLGFAAGTQTLLYLKGGLAYAHDTYTVTNLVAHSGTCSPTPGPDYDPVSQGRWGWTAGVGAEHAFSQHVTGFVEYDYADLGTQGVHFADTGNGCSPAWTAQVKQTVQTIKVGVNLKY